MSNEDIKAIGVKEGIKDGSPVFIGYFTTALAFGLLCRNSLLNFVEAVLISMTNFSGAGQFLMMNLYNAGSSLLSIAISVFLINLRYMFMSSSLVQRLDEREGSSLKLISAFGTTDENFSIAALKGVKLNKRYMAGLVFTSYAGWVSGTALGYVLGTFLPPVIQAASVITCYAMFASLLGSETKKNAKTLLVLLISGGLNTLLILLFKLSVGLSFVISMVVATVAAVFIYSDEEVAV